MDTYPTTKHATMRKSRFFHEIICMQWPSVRPVLLHCENHKESYCVRRIKHYFLSLFLRLENIKHCYRNIEINQKRDTLSTLYDLESSILLLGTMPDLLAQCINSIILTPSPKNEAKVSFNDLCKRYKDIKELEPLWTQMNNMQSDETVKYISAFTNISKHRTVIAFGIGIYGNDTDSQNYYVEPEFDEFTYNGHAYDSKGLRELIEYPNIMSRWIEDILGQLKVILLK